MLEDNDRKEEEIKSRKLKLGDTESRKLMILTCVCGQAQVKVPVRWVARSYNQQLLFGG